MKRLILLLAGTISLLAYIPSPVGAPPRRRPDYPAIAFLFNQNIAAGLTNADGRVWITADSNPVDAINRAIASWNAITTTAAHFSPIQSTSLIYNPNDGNHVITFTDDAFTRSFAGGTLATTATASRIDGTIVDTDIFFSPLFSFSTNFTPGTYDLQGILTHELGHALGANHTNILSSAMWFSTPTQDGRQRNLSSDDAAFVSSTYPAAGGNGYGTITGTAMVAGSPLLGGGLVAVDPFTGITVGGLSSVTDGSFSIQVPPGNYYVYVEPAASATLFLYDSSVSIFNSFQSAFAGGNTQPTLFEVTAGGSVTASPNASAGLSPLKIPFIAIGGAGLTGDFTGSLFSNAISISSGQSVDVIFGSPTSGAITEANIMAIGPGTLRAGSVRRDGNLTLTDGTPLYRFTLDIPALASASSETLVFQSGSNTITRSAVLTLTRPQAVNAGSFVGGAVAPGEILSYFGSGLGPTTPSSNGGFDANGQLPGTLAGVTATFDQTPAPLFYVSDSQVNLQVPYEISGKSQTVLSLLYNGTPVAKATLAVAKSAPGIFVVTNADGSVNGPNSPVSAGGTLVIYGTGAGLTSGSLRTGAAAPGNSTVAATVTLGGQNIAPTYSGLTPGSVGLTQVNVAVPAGIPAGDAIPLQYSINGSATQTVNISVR
jgi:uncharacterized protein (TIGR03437 family)